MRIALYVTLASLALGAMAVKYRPAADSRIWIDGTSSLHDWTCEVKNIQGSVNMESDTASIAAIQSASIIVPVRQIDCDKSKMNQKMWDALNAESFATIKYRLKSIKAREDSDNYSASGTLTITGVDKVFETPLKATLDQSGALLLSGSFPVKMSDYGIDPPTAMMGALKTGDDVTVRFELRMLLEETS